MASVGNNTAIVTRTAEKARGDLSNLFDPLKDADGLTETEPADIAIAHMLPYQKQALVFLKGPRGAPIGRVGPVEMRLEP